jgi:hypothetical protein
MWHIPDGSRGRWRLIVVKGAATPYRPHRAAVHGAEEDLAPVPAPAGAPERAEGPASRVPSRDGVDPARQPLGKRTNLVAQDNPVAVHFLFVDPARPVERGGNLGGVHQAESDALSQR